jgi:polysaccharide biosynthesis/export protein
MQSKRTYFLWIVLSMLFTTCAISAESTAAYRLNQGDSILISVWGEDTLQKDVKVLPDGSISFPLVGRIEVANSTAPDVEKRVTEKLKTYLSDPQVTVLISSIEGNKFYIIGKVLRPGSVLLTGPMTVLQALSYAGGLDKFADLGEIKVLRDTNKGQVVIPINYGKLINGQNLESNILLRTGDTILVP